MWCSPFVHLCRVSRSPRGPRLRARAAIRPDGPISVGASCSGRHFMKADAMAEHKPPAEVSSAELPSARDEGPAEAGARQLGPLRLPKA